MLYAEEARQPVTPGQAHEPVEGEVREHMATHVPFRPWCPFCVGGKAGSAPQYKKGGEESTMSVVST